MKESIEYSFYYIWSVDTPVNITVVSHHLIVRTVKLFLAHLSTISGELKVMLPLKFLVEHALNFLIEVGSTTIIISLMMRAHGAYFITLIIYKETIMLDIIVS